MPMHDWTRVPSGIYHAFHNTWIGDLQKACNDGLLPRLVGFTSAMAGSD